MWSTRGTEINFDTPAPKHRFQGKSLYKIAPFLVPATPPPIRRANCHETRGIMTFGQLYMQVCIGSGQSHHPQPIRDDSSGAPDEQKSTSTPQLQTIDSNIRVYIKSNRFWSPLHLPPFGKQIVRKHEESEHSGSYTCRYASAAAKGTIRHPSVMIHMEHQMSRNQLRHPSSKALIPR